MKKSLDDYYENFDGAMPERADWVSHFEIVKEFIGNLLPLQELRQWSGKSDFYTLFLTMGLNLRAA